MNKIILICGTENTRKTLYFQLKDYFGDSVDIESYATDSGINSILKGDLFLISSHLILEDALKYIEKNSKIIIAKRILNYLAIEKLLFIPSGEKVLFVNDCKETTYECLEWLQKIGITHVQYIPFYPGCKLIEKVEYAITPGEIEIVPENIKNIIDIGPRLLDISTIFEIAKELELKEDVVEKFSLIYFNKIIELGKNILQISLEKTKAFEYIKLIFDSMKDGIIAYDGNGVVKYINENLKFFQINTKNIKQININDIFSNIKILNFLLDNSFEKKEIFELKGNKYFVSKFKIEKDDIIVATFKDTKEIDEYEKKRIDELYKKGYYAKYTFDDIIGQSQKINFIKEIAKKVSKTDSTILIEGESGTGKELLASAIHNESERRFYPFVAINFSSLPESLAESELFGYEEGSFTGAIKGGKAGLFEQANRGTIFLDEIGDAPISLQKKLLRVLQEKEIMRIGGNKIIPVDVRIIAATNKDLKKLIENGEFREDLYYRLKVIYLKIPPLRERKEDIVLLLNYFLKKRGINLVIDSEIYDLLLKYDWSGNIRELKNVVEYISATCNGKELKINDLPMDLFVKSNSKIGSEQKIRKDLKILLDIIYQLDKNGQRISRRIIKRYCDEKGIKFSEQMIRTRLKELEKMGYIKINKGRAGIYSK